CAFLFGGIFSFSEGDLHGENFRLLVYVILSKGQARLVFMQRLLKPSPTSFSSKGLASAQVGLDGQDEGRTG
ncbi:MAG: hypothetical protein WC965_07070, partial [Thiohalomonadaceae bacterium]